MRRKTLQYIPISKKIPFYFKFALDKLNNIRYFILIS